MTLPPPACAFHNTAAAPLQPHHHPPIHVAARRLQLKFYWLAGLPIDQGPLKACVAAQTNRFKSLSVPVSTSVAIDLPPNPQKDLTRAPIFIHADPHLSQPCPWPSASATWHQVLLAARSAAAAPCCSAGPWCPGSGPPAWGSWSQGCPRSHSGLHVREGGVRGVRGVRGGGAAA